MVGSNSPSLTHGYTLSPPQDEEAEEPQGLLGRAQYQGHEGRRREACLALRMGWSAAEDGKAWADSWEPTANVSEDLRDDFWQERRRSASSVKVAVDVAPLDEVVQRRMSMQAMKKQGDLQTAFGAVYVVPIEELALKDLAAYYISTMAARYQVPVDEAFDPKTKVTTVGLEAEGEGGWRVLLLREAAVGKAHRHQEPSLQLWAQARLHSNHHPGDLSTLQGQHTSSRDGELRARVPHVQDQRHHW